MKVVRHAGYVEMELPEFFELVYNPEKLILIFSGLQSGHEKLLLDLSKAPLPMERQEHDQIVHYTQSLLTALESMRDTIVLLAFYTTKGKLAAVKPYVDQLEAFGFETRLFSNHQQALLWLGL